MTSSESAEAGVIADTSASARLWKKRALIGGGIVLALAAAVAVGTLLSEDPFARLPKDPDVMANVAGTLPAEGVAPLEEPAGIAMRGNRVFVSDSAAGVVRIFDRYGRDKGTIALTAADGVASRPGALALAEGGRLAIVDSGQGRVVVVKASAADEAKVLLTLGSAADGSAPARPVAVACADDEYFVIGSTEAKVWVYDADGAPVREVTLDPARPVAYPGGLLVADGTLWVSDTNSGRVSGFDARSGAAVAEWPDAYMVPRGMTVVADGFAVADVLGQSAYVCDAEGARTHVLDRESVEGVALVLPEAVAWDSVKSRLYVADSAGGNVVVLNVRVE